MDVNTIIIICLVSVFVLFILVRLAITNYAGENLLTVYNQYKNTYSSFLKTHELASTISNQEFNGKIAVEKTQGFLSERGRMQQSPHIRAVFRQLSWGTVLKREALQRMFSAKKNLF